VHAFEDLGLASLQFLERRDREWRDIRATVFHFHPAMLSVGCPWRGHGALERAGVDVRSIVIDADRNMRPVALNRAALRTPLPIQE
jgi:hypothetical protein